MGYYGIPRGSGKTSTSYKCSLQRQYEKGEIDFEHYITMMGTWLILADGIPEKQVLDWVKDQTRKHYSHDLTEAAEAEPLKEDKNNGN